MINRIALAILLCLVQSTVFAKSVSSRIDEVTVYPGGATITRVANVSLTAGTNQIELVGLVDELDASNIRVEIASDDVRIGQINLVEEQSRDVSDTEIAALLVKIEELNRQIRDLADESEAAKLQLEFLKGIATGYSKDASTDGVRGSADTNSWRAALSLLLSASVDANKMIRVNQEERQELTKDLSLLQRQLAELRGGGLSSTAVGLAMHSDRTLQTTIRFQYYLEDAYWRPKYEARLNSNTGALQLAQQANVVQETDEEWNGVRLTLSTSEPSGELMPPELDSEFLNIYSPQPIRQKERVQRLQSAVADNYSLEDVVVTGARVRANVGGFAVNYDVPGRSTVSNDDDEGVLLDLASFSFSTELVTRVVPRQSTQAFLTARFVYDQSVPLFGSEMLVFVDGAFAGYSEMPTALPRSEVVLPMGQDRRIAVTSESQGGEGGRGGVISKRKTEATDYLFELTNRRSTPSAVEVVDLYPVARNKNIDIDVPRTATLPHERDIDDKPGVVLWKKTLAPGETWRIKHQYSVSYPAKMILQTE